MTQVQPLIAIRRAELPANDEWVNQISGTPVRYWELLLESEVVGVDFEASWPLPVYSTARPSPSRTGETTSVG